MRPGYHADDKYRMVEDEFDATTRLFTAHMHRAEYLRLRKLAARRSPTAASKIARPVDPNAKMSSELEEKKRAEERRKVVEEALAKSGVRGRKKGGGECEEDEDEEVKGLKAIAKARDHDTDQWRGTHLASLMSGTSPEKKSRVSLVGLQGVKSSTRAAAGFTKPERKVKEGGRLLGYYESTAKSTHGGAPGPEKRKRDGPSRGDEHSLERTRVTTKSGHEAGGPLDNGSARSKTSASSADFGGRDRSNGLANKEKKKGPLGSSEVKGSAYSESKTVSLEEFRQDKGAEESNKHRNQGHLDVKTGGVLRETVSESERRRAAKRAKLEGKDEIKEGPSNRSVTDEIPLFMVV